MKRHILSLLLVVAAVGVSWGGSITHSTGVTASQFGYTTVGDSCVVLGWGDAELSYNPLQPQLPVFYYTFVVPTNCKVTGVTYRATNVDNRTLPHPVQCAPEPIPTGGSSQGIGDFNPILPVNPYTPFEITSDGYFDGDIHLVTVAYSPVNYTKGETTLSLNVYPSFTLNYQEGTIAENVKVIHPRGRDTAQRRQLINSMVVNPSSTPSFIPVSPSYLPPTPEQQANGIGYNYLVITTRELYATTQKLVDWKRSKGINAGAVCIEDILSQTWEDSNNQGFTEIDDAAGKLRIYLRNAHAAGLEYAFLVSERGEIPYRRYYSNNRTPTDFYYCELNGKWSFFTPITDVNTYSFSETLADIAVGRLFVSNTDELSNYIDRLITYERNPGKGNPEYLGKHFIIQSDVLQEKNYGRKIAQEIVTLFPDTLIWEENSGCYGDVSDTLSPKGKEVIDELQNSPCGIFSTYAHGGQAHIKTFSGGNNGLFEGEGRHSWVIRSVENDTIYDEWSFKTEGGNQYIESGAGIDLLHLSDNPFIVYSISCTTMPYDTTTLKEHPVTIGIAFTAKSESAVAYLGNTRDGGDFLNFDLHQKFNKQLLNNNVNIGKAEALSKEFTQDLSIIATHNLLGCPEIPMWTAVPQKITGTFLPSDSVSIISLSGEITEAAATEITEEHTITNSTISLIRRNYYPYYFPTKLQDYIFTGKRTLFGDDFTMGGNEGDTPSTFVVSRNSELTIEATGSFTLKPGTTIKSGGTLTIKHVKQ